MRATHTAGGCARPPTEPLCKTPSPPTPTPLLSDSPPSSFLCSISPPSSSSSSSSSSCSRRLRQTCRSTQSRRSSSAVTRSSSRPASSPGTAAHSTRRPRSTAPPRPCPTRSTPHTHTHTHTHTHHPCCLGCPCLMSLNHVFVSPVGDPAAQPDGARDVRSDQQHRAGAGGLPRPARGVSPKPRAGHMLQVLPLPFSFSTAQRPALGDPAPAPRSVPATAALPNAAAAGCVVLQVLQAPGPPVLWPDPDGPHAGPRARAV